MPVTAKAAFSSNTTFVRPVYFYIGGLSQMPHLQYFGVFLCFIYIFTVLGNVFLLSVIYQVRSLHTPKYMIVCNLALVDLCESTAFIPRVLETFFRSRYILYEACLSNMFFVYFFASLQAWTLVAMAYDRLVAICLPLRYHSLVTKQSLAVIFLLTWTFIFCLLVVIVKSIDRLSFCASVVLPNWFCGYTGTFFLACNDTTFNRIINTLVSVIFMIVPLAFIIITYVCIGIALIRIASAQERHKAMRTCTSHLILVSIFFLPITATTVAALFTKIHPTGGMITVCLTHVVPAFFNPIIFSLNTDEVLNSIKRLCGDKNVFKIIVAKRSKRQSRQT